MKLLNFSVIKLTACLVLGILLATYLSISNTSSLYATCFLLLLTSISLLASKGKTKSIWFGISSFLTMISIGVLVTNFHNEKRNPLHYTNYTSTAQQITFRIRTTLKSGLYNDKYIVDILKVDSTPARGKALLNITKDSILNKLKVDAVFITSESLQNIKGIINPYQFDYRSYLEKQYVYKQLYAKPERLFRVSENKHTIYGYADALREKINIKLHNYNFDPDVLSIINALILGQRQDLSKAIYEDYTDAGAVHILAVSGLHVALILLILNFILKPLKRFKYGRQTTIVLLVIIMWSFAIIAGLTASVTRAVTMFSIIAVGMHLKRPTNIYNTLAISVFVLLLFKPLFLFDVGFQLSYLAVIGIVAIQPKLVNIWQPKNVVISKVWEYFTVGIAAQFGVLPISLFYFHQFPGLFFVANVVIIPFLGFILGLGILVIILALLNALPQFLVDIFSYIISGMNSLMKWLSLQESFLFKDISFNSFQVIASYLLIIALVQLAIKRNGKRLILTLVTVVLFQSSYLFSKYKNNTQELTVFHKSRFTVIGDKNNESLVVYSDLDSVQQFYNLNDFIVGNNIKTVEEKLVPSVLKIKQSQLLIIDSLAVYQVTRFKPNYILLTQSPKLNMTRLIDSINPKLIIADGSNYKSYVARWKATCKTKKIPFHYTGEKGSFVFTLD